MVIGFLKFNISHSLLGIHLSSLHQTCPDCKWAQADEWVSWMDQIASRWTLGLGSCRETSWHGRLMDSHCPFIGTECDTWCLDGALLPPLTPHKHAVCCGLLEWLDTEWYLLLQRSILSAVLLASIKMDHSVNSNQVKCRRVRVSCFTQVLQILENWEMQWFIFLLEVMFTSS